MAKLISEELQKEGQNTRKYYQRRLPSNPAKDYYFIQRDTPNNETVIVEYGFLDSTGDDINQLNNNWKDYAEAVVRAVAEYKGISYIPESGSDYYVVKKGDTLWSIAKKFNITVNELKELNNKTTNSLSIGDTLKIKPNQIIEDDLNYYIVKKGDTLYGVAKKYNTTIDQLKKNNNLKSNTLSIGQKLFVGDDIVNTYTVKKGDTLYKIAQRYGITVDELKSANNLITNSIDINQVLKIPSKNSNIYTVVAGDNLYQIAQKFDTTVLKIIEANNLSNNNLSIGQKLIIP